MPDSNNPLASATSLAVGTTGTHPLSTSTSNDYYRFTLSGRSSVNLTLSGLNANMDLQLLGSSGTVLQQSTNTGTAAEAVNLTDLSAGVYYLRVFATESTNNAYYTLSLQAQKNAKTDLLWRNYSTGANALWYMNGTTLSSSAFLLTIPDANWRLEGRRILQGMGKPI